MVPRDNCMEVDRKRWKSLEFLKLVENYGSLWKLVVLMEVLVVEVHEKKRKYWSR